MNFDLVSSEIFHALRLDLTVFKFNNLESAVLVNPYLIVKIKSGSWYNGEYVNSINEVTFFDGFGNKINKIIDCRWELKNLTIETDFFVRKIHLHGIIVDPNGSHTEKLSFGAGIQGVIKALTHLREMSKFDSLSNYQMFIENNKIKKEIEKLKISNEEIRTQIQNLENS